MRQSNTHGNKKCVLETKKDRNKQIPLREYFITLQIVRVSSQL